MTISAQTLKWDVYYPDKDSWIELGEKGSVQEALVKEKILPDPFWGNNEKLFQWVEERNWTFRSTLIADASLLQHDYVELFFPGIDTYASVYINGNLVGTSENAFLPYRMEIKNYLREGNNEILLRFISPVNYHKGKYGKMLPRLPAPNDAGKVAVAPLSRKPQYQFGWDWAPRINTIGLNKQVEVCAYNQNKIRQAKVETRSIEKGTAVMELFLELAHPEQKGLQLKSEIWGDLGELNSRAGSIRIPVLLDNPKLWWPRGHGEASLYEDTWHLLDASGNLLEEKKIRFGVRTSELVQETDSVGKSFYFKINGKPIFCKGGNYIPQDVFLSRITDSSVVSLLKQLYHSNFNMVRVWGGGSYPDEIFFKTCDELGLMVWQDFMFACALYPGDEHFLREVEKEASYQIPRISSHPSVVYMNGNNEVMVASKYWGFQQKYHISAKTQQKLDENYTKLFQGMLPGLVEKYSFLPYVHTSPLSHWGKDEWYNSGTQHYWGVWHGKDPIEDFGKKSGRFNAEYGFQSFPEFSTLLAFSPKSEWKLDTEIMKNHQKSYVGNEMIRKHTVTLYGEPSDFEEFVYYSQLTQARAVSIAVSSHRLKAPVCMGTLYWQINDCWPAPTWSGIDYYGNWKALQYTIQKDFEDIAVLERTDKIGEEQYFILSDRDDTVAVKLLTEVFDLSGKLLEALREEFVFSGYQSYPLRNYYASPLFKDKDIVIRYSWVGENGIPKTRMFSHIVSKQEKKSPTIKLAVTSVNEVEKKACLEIQTDTFLEDAWIFLPEMKESGVHLEENFTSLLPGKHYVFFTYKNLPEESEFRILYR